VLLLLLLLLILDKCAHMRETQRRQLELSLSRMFSPRTIHDSNSIQHLCECLTGMDEPLLLHNTSLCPPNRGGRRFHIGSPKFPSMFTPSRLVHARRSLYKLNEDSKPMQRSPRNSHYAPYTTRGIRLISRSHRLY
jgi:hypothetical protein